MGNKLESTLSEINKKYGIGAVMNMSDKKVADVEVISSGSLGVNIALGIGGFPKGRIVEVIGWESSGKTTLAIHTMAEAHKANKDSKVAIVDAEHAFNPSYAEKLGVDLKRLYISQPDNGEQGLEIAEKLCSTGEFDVIVVDSVAALTPQAEINGEMGDSNMGVHARLMSQAMRKLTPIINKSNTCMIFINQLREKIGIAFGNPQVTTGGNALKFYATIRLEVQRSGQPNKDGDGHAISSKSKVKIIKNKLAPPFKTAEFDIVYDQGIDRVAEILDKATELGIVNKSGSWYSYNDSKLGQGRDATIVIMKDNIEMTEEIETMIMEGLKSE